MKLWHLKLDKRLQCWDGLAECVVRAHTEREARGLASMEAGAEGMIVWTDPVQTSCEELTAAGRRGVIVADFKEA